MSTILPAPNRQAIERVRAFNRSWTEVLGIARSTPARYGLHVDRGRILFELGRSRVGVDRLDLRDRLAIDQSFLGRVLSGLQRAGLVSVVRDDADGRRHRLSLTANGRLAYRDLDKRSAKQIRAMLVPLSLDQRRSMLESLTVLPALVRPGNHYRRDDIGMRGLEPGDLGWVVERHGAIYADEFGWNTDFEALVAHIVADYHDQHRVGRDERVDRHGRQRTRRMRVLCRARRFHRTAAHSARRAMGTWPRYRRPTGRRVHRVRSRRDTRR